MSIRISTVIILIFYIIISHSRPISQINDLRNFYFHIKNPDTTLTNISPNNSVINLFGNTILNENVTVKNKTDVKKKGSMSRSKIKNFAKHVTRNQENKMKTNGQMLLKQKSKFSLRKQILKRDVENSRKSADLPKLSGISLNPNILSTPSISSLEDKSHTTIFNNNISKSIFTISQIIELHPYFVIYNNATTKSHSENVSFQNNFKLNTLVLSPMIITNLSTTPVHHSDLLPILKTDNISEITFKNISNSLLLEKHTKLNTIVYLKQHPKISFESSSVSSNQNLTNTSKNNSEYTVLDSKHRFQINSTVITTSKSDSIRTLDDSNLLIVRILANVFDKLSTQPDKVNKTRTALVKTLKPRTETSYKIDMNTEQTFDTNSKYNFDKVNSTSPAEITLNLNSESVFNSTVFGLYNQTNIPHFELFIDRILEKILMTKQPENISTKSTKLFKKPKIHLKVIPTTEISILKPPVQVSFNISRFYKADENLIDKVMLHKFMIKEVKTTHPPLFTWNKKIYAITRVKNITVMSFHPNAITKSMYRDDKSHIKMMLALSRLPMQTYKNVLKNTIPQYIKPIVTKPKEALKPMQKFMQDFSNNKLITKYLTTIPYPYEIFLKTTSADVIKRTNRKSIWFLDQIQSPAKYHMKSESIYDETGINFHSVSSRSLKNLSNIDKDFLNYYYNSIKYNGLVVLASDLIKLLKLEISTPFSKFLYRDPITVTKHTKSYPFLKLFTKDLRTRIFFQKFSGKNKSRPKYYNTSDISSFSTTETLNAVTKYEPFQKRSWLIQKHVNKSDGKSVVYQIPIAVTKPATDRKRFTFTLLNIVTKLPIFNSKTYTLAQPDFNKTVTQTPNVQFETNQLNLTVSKSRFDLVQQYLNGIKNESQSKQYPITAVKTTTEQLAGQITKRKLITKIFMNLLPKFINAEIKKYILVDVIKNLSDPILKHDSPLAPFELQKPDSKDRHSLINQYMDSVKNTSALIKPVTRVFLNIIPSTMGIDLKKYFSHEFNFSSSVKTSTLGPKITPKTTKSIFALEKPKVALTQNRNWLIGFYLNRLKFIPYTYLYPVTATVNRTLYSIGGPTNIVTKQSLHLLPFTQESRMPGPEFKNTPVTKRPHYFSLPHNVTASLNPIFAIDKHALEYIRRNWWIKNYLNRLDNNSSLKIYPITLKVTGTNYFDGQIRFPVTRAVFKSISAMDDEIEYYLNIHRSSAASSKEQTGTSMCPAQYTSTPKSIFALDKLESSKRNWLIAYYLNSFRNLSMLTRFPFHPLGTSINLYTDSQDNQSEVVTKGEPTVPKKYATKYYDYFVTKRLSKSPYLIWDVKMATTTPYSIFAIEKPMLLPSRNSFVQELIKSDHIKKYPVTIKATIPVNLIEVVNNTKIPVTNTFYNIFSQRTEDVEENYYTQDVCKIFVNKNAEHSISSVCYMENITTPHPIFALSKPNFHLPKARLTFIQKYLKNKFENKSLITRKPIVKKTIANPVLKLGADNLVTKNNFKIFTATKKADYKKFWWFDPKNNLITKPPNPTFYRWFGEVPTTLKPIFSIKQNLKNRGWLVNEYLNYWKNESYSKRYPITISKYIEYISKYNLTESVDLQTLKTKSHFGVKKDMKIPFRPQFWDFRIISTTPTFYDTRKMTQSFKNLFTKYFISQGKSVNNLKQYPTTDYLLLKNKKMPFKVDYWNSTTPSNFYEVKSSYLPNSRLRERLVYYYSNVNNLKHSTASSILKSNHLLETNNLAVEKVDIIPEHRNVLFKPHFWNAGTSSTTSSGFTNNHPVNPSFEFWTKKHYLKYYTSQKPGYAFVNKVTKPLSNQTRKFTKTKMKQYDAKFIRLTKDPTWVPKIKPIPSKNSTVHGTTVENYRWFVHDYLKTYKYVSRFPVTATNKINSNPDADLKHIKLFKVIRKLDNNKKQQYLNDKIISLKKLLLTIPLSITYKPTTSTKTKLHDTKYPDWIQKIKQIPYRNISDQSTIVQNFSWFVQDYLKTYKYVSRFPVTVTDKINLNIDTNSKHINLFKAVKKTNKKQEHWSDKNILLKKLLESLPVFSTPSNFSSSNAYNATRTRMKLIKDPNWIWKTKSNPYKNLSVGITVQNYSRVTDMKWFVHEYLKTYKYVSRFPITVTNKITLNHDSNQKLLSDKNALLKQLLTLPMSITLKYPHTKKYQFIPYLSSTDEGSIAYPITNEPIAQVSWNIVRNKLTSKSYSVTGRSQPFPFKKRLSKTILDKYHKLISLLRHYTVDDTQNSTSQFFRQKTFDSFLFATSPSPYYFEYNKTYMPITRPLYVNDMTRTNILINFAVTAPYSIFTIKSKKIIKSRSGKNRNGFIRHYVKKNKPKSRKGSKIVLISPFLLSDKLRTKMHTRKYKNTLSTLRRPRKSSRIPHTTFSYIRRISRPNFNSYWSNPLLEAGVRLTIQPKRKHVFFKKYSTTSQRDVQRLTVLETESSSSTDEINPFVFPEIVTKDPLSTRHHFKYRIQKIQLYLNTFVPKTSKRKHRKHTRKSHGKNKTRVMKPFYIITREPTVTTERTKAWFKYKDMFKGSVNLITKETLKRGYLDQIFNQIQTVTRPSTPFDFEQWHRYVHPHHHQTTSTSTTRYQKLSYVDELKNKIIEQFISELFKNISRQNNLGSGFSFSKPTKANKGSENFALNFFNSDTEGTSYKYMTTGKSTMRRKIWKPIQFLYTNIEVPFTQASVIKSSLDDMERINNYNKLYAILLTKKYDDKKNVVTPVVSNSYSAFLNLIQGPVTRIYTTKRAINTNKFLEDYVYDAPVTKIYAKKVKIAKKLFVTVNNLRMPITRFPNTSTTPGPLFERTKYDYIIKNYGLLATRAPTTSTEKSVRRRTLYDMNILALPITRGVNTTTRRTPKVLFNMNLAAITRLLPISDLISATKRYPYQDINVGVPITKKYFGTDDDYHILPQAPFYNIYFPPIEDANDNNLTIKPSLELSLNKERIHLDDHYNYSQPVSNKYNYYRSKDMEWLPVLFGNVTASFEAK